MGFPSGAVSKDSTFNAGETPGSGKSSGEGNVNPLQNSFLGNPMDWGAWQATVHGVVRIGHNSMTKPPTTTTTGEQLNGYAADAAAESFQLCPTPCDPIDGSPPSSPIPRILQARTLEWVATSSSNAWKWKVKVKSLSHVWLAAAPWTAAHQASLSMGFSRQEYWSGAPLPSPQASLIWYVVHVGYALSWRVSYPNSCSLGTSEYDLIGK